MALPENGKLVVDTLEKGPAIRIQYGYGYGWIESAWKFRRRYLEIMPSLSGNNLDPHEQKASLNDVRTCNFNLDINHHQFRGVHINDKYNFFYFNRKYFL